jgi:hypothetical protein
MGKRTVAGALAVYGFALEDTEACGRVFAHPWEPSGFVCVVRPDGSAPVSFDDAAELRWYDDYDSEHMHVNAFASVAAIIKHLRAGARKVTVDGFGDGTVVVHWNDRGSIHDADGEPIDTDEFDVIAQHPSRRTAILDAIRECVATNATQTVEVEA